MGEKANTGGGSRRYRITVRGRLSEGAAGYAFEGMSFERGSEETTLVGDVVDQSQLYGVIDRLREFGAELVRVEQVPP